MSGVICPGSTLEQYATDFLPQGTNAPALHLAHFGVELTGKRVFQW
jgi:hypothetical protein